jgi:hypothetical protein
MRLNLLARRPIAAGAFLMLVAAGVLIAGLFLGSQYLQHLRGLSALETGLFFLPPALALMIGAITAGRLVGTIGTRPVAVVALALVAIGNALLIGLSADRRVHRRLHRIHRCRLRGRGALPTPCTVRNATDDRRPARPLTRLGLTAHHWACETQPRPYRRPWARRRRPTRRPGRRRPAVMRLRAVMGRFRKVCEIAMTQIQVVRGSRGRRPGVAGGRC